MKKLLMILVMVSWCNVGFAADHYFIIECKVKATDVKAGTLSKEKDLIIYGKEGYIRYFEIGTSKYPNFANTGWDSYDKEFLYWHGDLKMGNKFLKFNTTPGGEKRLTDIQVIDRETGIMTRTDYEGRPKKYRSECVKISKDQLPIKEVEQKF